MEAVEELVTRRMLHEHSAPSDHMTPGTVISRVKQFIQEGQQAEVTGDIINAISCFERGICFLLGNAVHLAAHQLLPSNKKLANKLTSLKQIDLKRTIDHATANAQRKRPLREIQRTADDDDRLSTQRVLDFNVNMPPKKICVTNTTGTMSEAEVCMQ